MVHKPSSIPMSPTASFDDEDVRIDVKDGDQVLHSVGTPAKEQSFSSFCWRKSSCFLPIFVVVGVITVVMLVLQPTKEQVPFADSIFFRDGWEGLTSADLPRWNTRGAGVLKIEMLNALEDVWQPYFEKALQDWNNGDPDVIELTATKVQPNSECDFVSGKYAICAGDYGDSGYHGFNEIIVHSGYITASVAKLNDFYLSTVTATENRKQYTMCHEIGHGLGLPHADENFFNMNLGNCMDYTDRPWTNTAPDKPTFLLLQQMYGTTATSTTSSTTSSTSTTTSNTKPDDESNTKPDDESETKPDDDGYHGFGSSSTGTVLSSASGSSMTQPQQAAQQQGEGGTNRDENQSIPDSIRQRAKEAADNLRQSFADDKSKLQGDEATAGFQFDLGDGYVLQTQFLLAN